MPLRSAALDYEHLQKSRRLAFVLTTGLALGAAAFLLKEPLKPLKVKAAEPQVELLLEQFVPTPVVAHAIEPEPDVRTLTAQESDFTVAEVVSEKLPEPEAVKLPEPKIDPLPEPIPEVKKEPEVIKEPEPVPPVVKPIPKQPEVKVKKPVVKEKSGQSKPVQAATDGTAAQSKSTVELAGAAEAAKQKDQLLSLLVGLVEKNKRYPKSARRAGQEGTLQVLFKISASGRILSALVQKKTDYDVLNETTEELAQKLVGTELNVANKGISILVPIRYSLR